MEDVYVIHYADTSDVDIYKSFETALAAAWAVTHEVIEWYQKHDKFDMAEDTYNNWKEETADVSADNAEFYIENVCWLTKQKIMD
jgi:NTP pyrophosphatase (non-canonical NTP hydrolase)